ncbi:NUDIX hydrolase [Staphylococcus haemolyticus]|uniref:NUDIX hydrolase n=1 Tax=Staphylococcus haemolyticus TaxID=1283 RepID=UPI0028FEE930|nr:NUDIX hydrolase [Staphylococcus haemolyticus]MDU0423595.1 NUDIX hydrolase [Staphylococcus haemolyticus]MDU0440485.1 NUDIX hydrolase [Staphylococcus haemolyticus]MDU0442815.1 NUDIX hydrolase [Staphylococcus haemolyticus]MDU0445151.1 NUDIX hydrolase [Staphylococcus haemolyticus]MDU0449912.1 NUDIX hydrolase [Staphylococcus haemolyticus]
MKDLKVVYSLIQNEEGNVLLVHNTDGGGWSLPGGKVEYGETLVEALKREVREETGLFVEVNDIVSVNEGKSTQMNVHTLFIMFKAQVQDYTTDIQMKDEISTLGWFSIPEADEKLIYYHHSLNALLNNKATYCDEGFVD